VWRAFVKRRSEQSLSSTNVDGSPWLPSLDSGLKKYCEIRRLPYAINPYHDVDNIHVAFPSYSLRHMIAVYHQVHHKIDDTDPVIIYPTGSVSLVFCCDSRQPGAFFIGTSTYPRHAEYSLPGMDYFVVTFWPGRAYSFIPIHSTELIDNYIPIQEILPEDSKRITEDILLAPAFEERIRIWESFIEKRTSRLTAIPTKVSYLVEEIWKSQWQVNKKILLKYDCYSDRHIRRLFHKYVGISPKLFADIARYQNILRTIGDYRHQGIFRLALEQGYFDQSHFIKEFKRFQGTTPGQFINEFLPHKRNNG
jgi:hypothetical protein